MHRRPGSRPFPCRPIWRKTLNWSKGSGRAFDRAAWPYYGDSMGHLTATLEELADRVNENPGLVRRGRFVSLEWLLQIGAEDHYLTIENGRLAAVTPGPVLMRSSRFTIHIEEDAWQRFCRPVPRPGYYDLFGMCKLGVARIDGDFHPLIANLRYFREMLAMARLETDEVTHGS